MIKVIKNFERYDYCRNEESIMECVFMINEFDYSYLDSVFGDIEFLFNIKKNEEYLYNYLYKSVVDARQEV